MIAGIVALALRRSRPTRLGDVVRPAAFEFAIVASLYSVWRMTKNLPLTQAEGAIERAYDIVAVQEFFRLPSELSLPHWRDALAILTAFCLFIRFVKVAPPRFPPISATSTCR